MYVSSAMFKDFEFFSADASSAINESYQVKQSVLVYCYRCNKSVIYVWGSISIPLWESSDLRWPVWIHFNI